MIKTIALVFVFALFMGSTFGFGLDLISNLLPDIKTTFSLTDGDIGWVTGIGRLGFVAGAIIAGLLAAYIAPTLIVVLATLGCGATMVGLANTNSATGVAVTIFLISVCTSLSWVPMTGVFSIFVSEGNRTKAFGAIIAGAGIGTSLAGLFSPYFVGNYSWREALMAAAALTWVVVFVGLIVIAHFGILSKRNQVRQSVGELAQQQRLRTYLDVRLGGILCMFFMVGFTVHPFQIFLSTYIRDELGFSVTVAGNTWLTIGLVGTWAGLFMGYLGDRFGIRNTMILASLLLVASVLMLIEIHEPIWFLATAFVFSLAYYCMPGLLPAYLSIHYPAHISVQLFSAGGVILGLGTVIGNIIGGQLSEWFLTLDAYYWACAFVSVILALFALIFMLPAKKKVGTAENCRIIG